MSKSTAYIFLLNFYGFRPYIEFILRFFFFIWCKKVVQFNSFACSSLVFHLLKRLYFPHYIDCISIGLFLGSLLCSIDLCICFCVSTILYFDYSSFIVNLKSGSMIPLALLFSLKIALAIRGLLWFSYKF